MTNKIDYRRKDIDVEKVFDLMVNHNHSQSDVARILGCSKQNINKLIQRYFPELQALRGYKKHRGDILASFQAKILSKIDNAIIDKANLRDKITAMAILYDKERLERGQSTQNISVRQLVDKYKTIEQAEAEILSELISIEKEDAKEE